MSVVILSTFFQVAHNYMSAPGTNPLANNESWDAYWRASTDASAYSSNGISHPAVRQFWSDFFTAVCAVHAAPAMLDVASGNGAVVEIATSQFPVALTDITCLDISAQAVASLKQRFPRVTTMVANASRLPLQSATFAIATSLFGVEYAGPGAIEEMCRVVAPAGQLGLVMHHKDGNICRDCTASLDAVTRLRQSNFIPLSIALFEHGYAAAQGEDRAAYDAAASALSPAVAVLEDIMRDHGQSVADSLVFRIYDDVATMHEQIVRYEPSDVLGWLGSMDIELAAFAGRMAAMVDAALDSAQFATLVQQLTEAGWRIDVSKTLAADESHPLAWGLVATRMDGKKS